MYLPKIYIDRLFLALNEAGVSYILMKNIGNELPDKLSIEKDVDIFVFPESKELFENTISSIGFKLIIHPFGKETGWIFAYGVDEFQFWQLEEDGYIFNVDVMFAISCRSMYPKVWMPLDKLINESTVKNKVFDELNGWWIMDEKNMLIYLIVRSVFDKSNFTPEYIPEIEKRKNLLSDEYVKSALGLVFFAFTPKLIELIQKGLYNSIVEEHITFKEY